MLFRAFAVCLALSSAQPADVLTQHNDLARTGANLNETVLTPATVNKDRFGKLFDVPVDGMIYAQPLVVSGLSIKGRTRNVVCVATEHNSLYIIDGDTGEVLWMKNYGPSMPTPNAILPAVANNSPYHDLNPEHGITSTPVIDKETRTIYFTTYLQRRAPVEPWVTFHHYLHAVDLESGAEKFSGPTEIDACLFSPLAAAINEGKEHRGRHKVNPLLCFEPMQHMQRPAVVLIKPPGGALPQIILGFGSHGDYPVFHGWLLSYQADKISHQLGVWVTNTDNSSYGSGAAIWQAGMGPAVDDDFNVFVMTGNGLTDEVTFGESFVRFSTAKNTISQTDRFSPCNQVALDKIDDDLGSSGPLLIADRTLTPRPNLLVGGGKEGRLYVFDKDHLGGISTTCDANGFDPNVPQEFQAILRTSVHHFTHIHGSPVYWKSDARGPVIYVWGENDHLRAYPLVLQDTPQGRQWRFDTFIRAPGSRPPAWAVGMATSPLEPWNEMDSMMTGGMLSISANGGKDGIVWAATPLNNDANLKVVPGILHAYDAADLSKELWNSLQNSSYDDFGNYAKFTPVTVANGKVYVPTFSYHLSVYGPRTGELATVPVSFVKNGTFEEGTASWKSNQPTFTGNSFSYHGKLNGLLCPVLLENYSPHVCAPLQADAKTPRRLEMSQTIPAPKTGKFTLKVKCATNILPFNFWLTPKGEKPAAVTVGVDVGTATAGSKTVLANVGYQSYSVDFTATKGQPIHIWYRAPKVVVEGSIPRKLISPEAWAAIDDVELISH